MPNPDDQALFLIKGLRAREQRAMKRLVAAADDLASHSAQAKGSVVAFTGAALSGPMRRLRPADVISLAKGRAARTERGTTTGRVIARLPEPIA